MGGHRLIAIAVLSACATNPTNDPTDPTDPTEPPLPQRFDVTLVPNGVSGTQRVSFAIPLPKTALADDTLRVLVGDDEVPSARRVLATYADGSARSVLVQVDVDAA